MSSVTRKVRAPLVGLAGCQNIFKEPKSFYTAKKVNKSLEGLAGCQNIFKEPKSFYTAKKVKKPLEGLTGCQNIFKEPKSFYTAKKVKKSLEGLAGCQNIFKEPRVVYTPKSQKTCSQCGGLGHNKRTCRVLTCTPCVLQCDIPTKIESRIAKDLLKILNTPSILPSVSSAPSH